MQANQGKCVGTMRYGTMVQFWCESTTGGPTDSVIVSVEFANEAIAAQVAAAAGFDNLERLGHVMNGSDHCEVCYAEAYQGNAWYDGCSSGGDEVNNTDPVVIGRLNLALAAGVPSPNRAARRSMVRRRKGGVS